MLRTIVKRAGLCLVLAGLGLAAVWGGWHLMELREPRVDFSPQLRVTGVPAPQPGGNDARLRFAVATMVSAEATFSTYRRLVRISNKRGTSNLWICFYNKLGHLFGIVKSERPFD